jgi:hypothetical protein
MMNFPLEIIVELKIQVNPIIKVWSSHQSIIIIFFLNSTNIILILIISFI